MEVGLTQAIKRGFLGQVKIDSIQIENSLSGGKTGAAVFVARYGVLSSKLKTDGQNNSSETNTQESTFIRVLKIAPKEICHSENEGYVKTRETLLDIYSQVEYYPSDEFENNGKEYGILLYQDVGTVAASDLKGVARYFIHRILTKSLKEEEAEKFSKELSLLLQKEVFLGLKKGLYGNLQRKNVNLSEYYGDKLSSKVKDEFAALKKIDSSLPDFETVLNYFNVQATYHQVNFIHGDLNPENVLVWENERGFLSCKLIDFGEVIPKKNNNFTPLFWDFSRLLGEVILNFVEESALTETSNSDADNMLNSIDRILNEFWSVVEAFFKNDSSKLENSDKKISFISRIYLSTLFDFINEAKSGMKDLRRGEVIQDYFYCQILFFLFYAKFQRENPYKRIFGIKLAVKLYEYANSGEIALQSLIHSLEKFYFEFSNASVKNKKPQIGPLVGAHSPYMGLSYFEEKDKDYFFGREKFIEELLKAIEEKPIIVLAGASGSGKSSVVHAGVFPILRGKNYLIYKFRPGSFPLQAAINAFPGNEITDLRTIIIDILKQNPDKKMFLLGDQFEELFTLAKDDLERRELGETILEIAKEYKNQFRFFITIRADFLTKLLEDSSFASVIGDSGANKNLGQRFLLSPMSTEELRTAIEKPLEVANLQIQEGLTDLILTSVANQPGSLPLLEFCLEELWKRQIDFTLQYNSYKDIGEVKGALATYADQEYKKLSEIEKELLKKIMLQLIQPGQGTEDTRRIALVEEILINPEFIGKLADMRLITTGTNEEGKQTLEVVHEALIREWGKLREWINADREFRVWQEKLRYAVKEWESGEKEEATFLRGHGLVIAEEWYRSRKEDMGIREIEFIEKSVESRDRVIAKEKDAEAKKDKLKKVIFVISVAIFTFSMELSVFSFSKMRESERNEEKVNVLIAEIEYESTSSYLKNYYNVIKAGMNTFKELKTNLYERSAMQKVFKALANFTFDLKNINLAINQNNKSGLILRPKFSLPFSSFSFSVDGKQFVTHDSKNSFFIRDSKTSSIIKTIVDKSDKPLAAFFSIDGKELVTITEHLEEKKKSFLDFSFSSSQSNSTIVIKRIEMDSGKLLKNIASEIKLEQTDFMNDAESVSFQNFAISSDRNFIAYNFKGKFVICDLETGNEIQIVNNSGVVINRLLFSPDGKFLISLSFGEKIRFWNRKDGKEISNLPYPNENIKNINFSSDGNLLVILSMYQSGRNVGIWDFKLGKEIKSFSLTNLTSASFSPNGEFIAFADYSGEIRILDINSGKEIQKLKTINAEIIDLQFNSDRQASLISVYKNEKLEDGSLEGFIGEEEIIDDLARSIQSKTVSENTLTQNIIKLLFDPNTFMYKSKGTLFDPEVYLDLDSFEALISKSCNDFMPQFINWATQSNPPFPKREINTVKHSCEEIIKKGEK